MPGGNLNKEIFLNTVKSDAANGTANAVSMLKRSCPELSDAHCEHHRNNYQCNEYVRGR